MHKHMYNIMYICMTTMKLKKRFLTLIDKRKDETRTCTNVKKTFSWIECDGNNKFAPLQCNPHMKRCFCVHADSGKRVNSKTFPIKMKDSDVCDTCKCDIRHTYTLTHT